MLIQFEKSTRGAYGATSDSSRLDMREGASRNPAIQLRTSTSEIFHPVASSRVEENDQASFLSRSCAALRDVAAIAAAVLLVSATGIGITAAIYLLLFCSF